MPKPLFAIIAAVLSSHPAVAGGNDHQHVHSSSYAGEETREIKALTKEDIDELLRGGGWGLAKAAELNGMPGPTHVPDMATELSLSDGQIERTRQIRDDMRREAKQFGERFVAKEAELEARFRAGDIAEAELVARVSEIEAIRAKLRAAHLSAHIEMARVLSAAQIERYRMLRGYK